MAIAFEPGEEIRLEVKAKRHFFTNAKSWKQQKDLNRQIDKLKEFDADEEATDAGLDILAEHLTRTEPAIELNRESLEKSVDYRLIWALLAAIRFNSTFEEKKSSE